MKIKLALLVGMVMTILIFVGIMLYFNDDCCMCGSTEQDCCPCPNHEYLHKVADYYGVHPSGTWSWHKLCEDYKKDTGEEFDCFE